ncbi:hypothetical protein L873DRAFT_172174 [Choiromyces venosus 120613-1]|uniref:Transmembrane protein n=1 Tax=Choiromyces venosus 120613-1 TaxID=1336337 RepID=A0A3N4K546_9PEZI|nr:hypothetical protein L873DRAFT_172174 [Choiromyces venosus 120613-1]
MVCECYLVICYWRSGLGGGGIGDMVWWSHEWRVGNFGGGVVVYVVGGWSALLYGGYWKALSIIKVEGKKHDREEFGGFFLSRDR